MSEASNVFISWSGPRSKAAAEALKEWLPMIIQAARPWMSATDIDKGTRWREEVSVALDSMRAGIICVTPENRSAEWLLFEAGALSKTRDPKTRVWTYLLLGLKPKDLKDPLAMFNHTLAVKEDTRELIHSINVNLDGAVAENSLDRLFDKLWPDLDEKLSNLPAPTVAIPPARSSDEMIVEILELTRAAAQSRKAVEDLDQYIPTLKKFMPLFEQAVGVSAQQLPLSPPPNHPTIAAADAENIFLIKWRGHDKPKRLRAYALMDVPGKEGALAAFGKSGNVIDYFENVERWWPEGADPTIKQEPQ